MHQRRTGAVAHDFEYIICNNHSKDRSGEIAADYAARDPRIRVVSPPTFVPQARNFNFALSQISARAEYCKMLHADDWMYPRCLREMTEVARIQPPHRAMVSAYRLIGDQPDCFRVPVERSSFSGREGISLAAAGHRVSRSQSTVMYSADVVRKRAPSFFPEKRFFMDVDVAFRILADGDFGFVHQVLTYSRYQPDSITDSASHFNWWALLRYPDDGTVRT